MVKVCMPFAHLAYKLCALESMLCSLSAGVVRSSDDVSHQNSRQALSKYCTCAVYGASTYC